MTDSETFVTDIATTVVEIFGPTNLTSLFSSTNSLLSYSAPGTASNTTLGDGISPTGEADPPMRFPESFEIPIRVVVPIIIAIIAIIGLVGNGTVLCIIFKYREMQNITNYFIANLALTDVAMLAICAIPTAANIAGMAMEEGLCKGMNYMQFVSTSYFSSYFTISGQNACRVIYQLHRVQKIYEFLHPIA